MRYLKTLASAVAVVMLLVMATDYVAMAATGKPIIMGKVNKSGKTTTIKSTNGPALNLKTKVGQPPLKVNQKTVAPNLNADLVDGKSANQLGVRTRVEPLSFSGAGVTEVIDVLPTMPAGTYLVDYSMWLYAAANTSGFCQLGVNGITRAPASVAGLSGGFFIANSSSVIKLAGTETLQVRCNFSAATGVSTYDGRISFTSVDVASGTGAVAPKLGKVRGTPADR